MKHNSHQTDILQVQYRAAESRDFRIPRRIHENEASSQDLQVDRKKSSYLTNTHSA